MTKGPQKFKSLKVPTDTTAAAHSILDPKIWHFLTFLADLGEVRGCITNTVVINSIIH